MVKVQPAQPVPWAPEVDLDPQEALDPLASLPLANLDHMACLDQWDREERPV